MLSVAVSSSLLAGSLSSKSAPSLGIIRVSNIDLDSV